MAGNGDAIRAFVAAMNAHDSSAVRACYRDDAVIVYPGRPPRGPDEYAASEKAMLEAVPDYHIEPLSLLEAEGGHVLLELRMSGRQRADPGGKPFDVTGAYVFRLEAGLIVEERAYPDMAGLRKALS